MASYPIGLFGRPPISPNLFVVGYHWPNSDDFRTLVASELLGPSTSASPQSAAPAVGTLAVSGYAPTIGQGANQGVSPSVGSLTFTGYSPAIAQPIAADPAVGTLSLVGFAPTVLQPYALTLTQGTLTFTGHAPTVAQFAGQSINPEAGLVAVTGYAPAVSQLAHQQISPDVGAIVLTGYAPSVVQLNGFSINPNVGTLSITGHAPDVSQSVVDRFIFPSAGAISLTGHAPTVRQGGFTIESMIFTAFKGVVGNRVYPDTFVQPNGTIATWPAIRYSIIGGTIDQDIAGAGTEQTDDTTFQLDLVARTTSEREALRQQVRAAAQGLNPPMILRAPPTQEYDPETKTYRATLEFTIYGSS
jgi:hypothetical protein